MYFSKLRSTCPDMLYPSWKSSLLTWLVRVNWNRNIKKLSTLCKWFYCRNVPWNMDLEVGPWIFLVSIKLLYRYQSFWQYQFSWGNKKREPLERSNILCQNLSYYRVWGHFLAQLDSKSSSKLVVKIFHKVYYLFVPMTSSTISFFGLHQDDFINQWLCEAVSAQLSSACR